MESALFGFAGRLLATTGTYAFQQYVGNKWAFGSEEDYETLRETLSAIEAVLLDAEEKQRTNHLVRDLLMRTKLVFNDIEDLLQEVTTRALKLEVESKEKNNTWAEKVFSFPSSISNQALSRVELGGKVMLINEKLVAIEQNFSRFNLTQRHDGMPSIRSTKRVETPSHVPRNKFIGREEGKSFVTKHLTESDAKYDVSVISIVGVGGLGKTALAQYVCDSDEVKGNNFDLILSVCVSNVFDVPQICKDIIEVATREKCVSSQMGILKNDLKSVIDGRKYLLVLDDVWNECPIEWNGLRELLAGGAKGSKILITARTETAARAAKSNATHFLKRLSTEESWELFKQAAFEQGVEPESPTIIRIGKKVAEICDGNPLAIKSIGLTLGQSMDEEDWLSFEKDVLPGIEQAGDEKVISILKLSYDYLSAPLKRCFEYCAVFPKDYQIEKETLIRMWMAQGLVQLDGTPRSLEDVGNQHWKDLLNRSFFEPYDKYNDGSTWCYKMHDEIRKVAASVGGKEYYNNHSLGVNGINESTLHAWVSPETSTGLSHAKKLRTLVVTAAAGSSDMLDGREAGETVGAFEMMRLLDMGHSGITEVPEFVGGLIHLHYLDLSGNTFDSLPECTCSLYNLQTLILFGCVNLKELPKGTKNLVRLRHLDISECDKLSHMPRGLGELTCLQKLSDFVMGPEGKECAGLDELGSLVDLRGELTVTILRGSNVVEGHISHPTTTPLAQLKFVEHLTLRWAEVMEEEEEEDMEEDVEHLNLEEAMEEDEVTEDIEHLNLRGVMEDIEHLNLEETTEEEGSMEEEAEELLLWESLKPHTNLKKLTVAGYGGKKFPSWLDTANIKTSLPNVVCIELASCESWQHFTQFGLLPRLQQLCLCDLDGIEYIYDEEEEKRSNHNNSSTNVDGASTSSSGGGGATTTTLERELPAVQLFPCLNLLDLSWMPMLRRLVGPTATSRLHNRRDGEQFLTLTSLREVRFSYVESPPIWLQYLPKLQTLQLSHCNHMETLPEWMGNLTSLQEIRLQFCKSLASIPDCMLRLTSMQRLQVYGCPMLIDRCHKETGEDWHKIAHIPNVSVTVYGSSLLSKIYYETCIAPESSPSLAG